MASEPQLKIKLTADTSGYQKGMQASKQEVRDLESVSSNALGSIAGALGINAGKVQQKPVYCLKLRMNQLVLIL